MKLTPNQILVLRLIRDGEDPYAGKRAGDRCGRTATLKSLRGWGALDDDFGITAEGCAELARIDRRNTELFSEVQMNQNEVIQLMSSSKSEVEWNANCNKVKFACGGHYPQFWFAAIIISGLAARVQATWPHPITT